jgi:hypothetical protein
MEPFIRLALMYHIVLYNTNGSVELSLVYVVY